MHVPRSVQRYVHLPEQTYLIHKFIKKRLPVNAPTYLLALHIHGPRFTTPKNLLLFAQRFESCKSSFTAIHQQMLKGTGVIFRSAASVKQFPNLRVCLSNYTCHSFPNLKNCLITSVLPQNTQHSTTALTSISWPFIQMLKTSTLGNGLADRC